MIDLNWKSTFEFLDTPGSPPPTLDSAIHTVKLLRAMANRRGALLKQSKEAEAALKQELFIIQRRCLAMEEKFKKEFPMDDLLKDILH